MAKKARIYKEKDVVCDLDLLKQLNDAFIELEQQMKATISIHKGLCVAGYGVSKTQRGIAADAVISIAKAIKNLKGW